ncbi:MAG: HD domain-containing protein, partial [Butyrivibrio sp.]|nr:HD domain-containing protein [Butyrivibrio sp.]
MTEEENFKQRLKIDETPLNPPVGNTPDELFEELKKYILQYHPSTDLSQVEKAYKVAKEAHKDQKRKSGEPYIIHPLYVAIILAQLELDKETIIAGLLHDVVEDTAVTGEELENKFGS